jgi:hypothetical protein
VVSGDTFKRFSRTLGAAPTTSGHLGYKIDAGGLVSSTILSPAPISIVPAGTFLVNVYVQVVIPSSTALSIVLPSPAGVSIGFSAAYGNFYQSVVCIFVAVSNGNYTYNFGGIGGGGQGSITGVTYNYSILRIA